MYDDIQISWMYDIQISSMYDDIQISWMYDDILFEKDQLEILPLICFLSFQFFLYIVISSILENNILCPRSLFKTQLQEHGSDSCSKQNSFLL